VTILQATVIEPFRYCCPFKTQEGNNTWSRLEHLPALHETVHTSEKFWNALVLHLHRLHAPFQVSVAGLKQNFIAARSLLDSMTVWFYCTTINKNVP
jgi:hypothetical protein